MALFSNLKHFNSITVINKMSYDVLFFSSVCEQIYKDTDHYNCTIYMLNSKYLFQEISFYLFERSWEQRKEKKQFELTPKHSLRTSVLKSSILTWIFSSVIGMERKWVKGCFCRAEITKSSTRVRAELTPFLSRPTITEQKEKKAEKNFAFYFIYWK